MQELRSGDTSCSKKAILKFFRVEFYHYQESFTRFNNVIFTIMQRNKIKCSLNYFNLQIWTKERSYCPHAICRCWCRGFGSFDDWRRIPQRYKTRARLNKINFVHLQWDWNWIVQLQHTDCPRIFFFAVLLLFPATSMPQRYAIIIYLL